MVKSKYSPMDEQEVEVKKGNGYFDRNDFREIESEFYSCKRLIKSKIKELNPQEIGFNFHVDDNSQELFENRFFQMTH